MPPFQAHSPHGSWQRIERGELTLDDSFFTAFHAELTDQKHWRNYCLKLRADPARRGVMDELLRRSGKDSSTAADAVPDMPRINAKEMFWNMMRTARSPDPYMFPALIKLRKSGRFIIAALSNTIAFPPGVMDEKGQLFKSQVRSSSNSNGSQAAELGEIRDHFDVFVSSAHVGLRKPEKRIYDMALEEIRKEAKQRGMDGTIETGDIVFLDDIGGNLKAAKKLGFRTIKVNLGKSKDAVRELESAVGMSLIDESSRL